MKKTLKNNKGFSMIELLVALLIMAVIAGIAITLYSGVLNSSKTNADRQTAAEIKRQILIYINASNDIDLSCVGGGTRPTTGTGFVDAMTNPAGVVVAASGTNGANAGDIQGTYGPYFENLGASGTVKGPRPQGNGMVSWDIDVDSKTLVITVVPSATVDTLTVT